MNPDLNAPWPEHQAPAASLTSDQVLEFLESQDIPVACIFCVDSVYSLPAVEWVTGPFSQALTQLQNAMGFRYQAESEDCDDYARLAAVFAQFLQNRTMPGDSALAFAEFAYKCETSKGGDDGHAVCAIITRINGSLELLFFEPQPAIVSGGLASFTMQHKSLTTWEKSHCLFCRF